MCVAPKSCSIVKIVADREWLITYENQVSQVTAGDGAGNYEDSRWSYLQRRSCCNIKAKISNSISDSSFLYPASPMLFLHLDGERLEHATRNKPVSRPTRWYLAAEVDVPARNNRIILLLDTGTAAQPMNGWWENKCRSHDGESEFGTSYTYTSKITGMSPSNVLRMDVSLWKVVVQKLSHIYDYRECALGHS